MCSGYGTAFDGFGSWIFGNDIAKNVRVSAVGNRSLSHSDSCRNNFLELSEGPTDDINDTISPAEQNFSINNPKVNPEVCLSLQCNGDKCYLFFHGKTTICLKLIIKL